MIAPEAPLLSLTPQHMKSFFLILFLLIVQTALAAQDSLFTYFNKAFYDAPNALNTSSLVTIEDGSIFLCAKLYKPEIGTDILLMKLNSMGDLLWIKNLVSLPVEHSVAYMQRETMAYSADETILIAYSKFDISDYDTFIMKVDLNGALIWHQEFAAENSPRVMSLCTSEDNSILMSGFNQNQQGAFELLAVKYDSEGQELWHNKYHYEDLGLVNPGPDCNTYASTSISLEDDSFLIGGIIGGSACTEDQDCILLKIDIHGQLFWHEVLSSTCDDSQPQLLLNRENRLLMSSACGTYGFLRIWELNFAGHELNEKFYNDEKIIGLRSPLVELADGYMGIIDIEEFNNPAILRLDADLQIMWLKEITFAELPSIGGSDLKRSSDGGLIHVGGLPYISTTTGSGTTYGFTWVAKFDTLGNNCEDWEELCDSVVYELSSGIDEISNFEINFSIHPIPSRGMLNLSYRLPTKSTSASIQIFDQQGREQARFALPLFAEQQQVDVSHLPIGPYLYLLNIDAEVVKQGKLIKY